MDREKTISRLARLLWVIVFILTAIGIAMVIRRILTMAHIIPSVNPAGGPPFDTSFGKHPVITLLHILPGALFMLLGPLQFMRSIRARHIRFHRRSGYVYIVCAYIVGFSAVSMPFVMLPIGGINEAAGSMLFGIFFLIALSKAWRHIVRKELALHREWMIRAYAIGLAVATIRPIMVLFFAFSGLEPQVFFGTAFWIGFTIHLITAEVWINYTRGRSF